MSESMELVPPMPSVTPTTRPFWDALAEGRVSLQRCEDCGGWVFYPRVRCNHCLSDALHWQEASGRASLYTWTVCERAPAPHFEAWVPYVLAVVEFEEGPRMTTLLVDVDGVELHAGMPLVAAIDRTEALPLLRFRPESAA